MKIIDSRLDIYSGRFSLIAFFKWINCVRSCEVPVTHNIEYHSSAPALAQWIFGCDISCWLGLINDCFSLQIATMYLFFIISYNPMWKRLLFMTLEQTCWDLKSPFNVSSFQFMCHPISLLLNELNPAAFNDFASSSCVWYGRSSNNASKSSLSNFIAIATSESCESVRTSWSHDRAWYPLAFYSVQRLNSWLFQMKIKRSFSQITLLWNKIRNFRATIKL